MKSIAIVIFLGIFLIAKNIYSQNLVPNASFELLHCGSPYITAYEMCSWVTPPADGNTPDGFEDSLGFCFPCLCIPGDNTFAGNTYAANGNHFVGIMGYYIQGGQMNGREYIHALLNQPLVAGEQYLIGFQIKYGSRSKYMIDHFGMFISDSAYGPTNTYPLYDVIPVNPQLDINTTMGDSANWTTVTDIYTATGGEQYVTLGNFIPDSLLNVSLNPLFLPIDTTCLLRTYSSYFFIDSVFIFHQVKTMSVEEETNHIKIFPNPFKEELHIHFSNVITKGQISLYNLYGEKILNLYIILENDIGIPRNEMPAGIYYLEIETESYKKDRIKIIVND